MIRAWSEGGDYRRDHSLAGLEVLAQIGSDAALAALYDIATDPLHPALQRDARAGLDQVADGMGLSGEELADRLSPEQDLDVFIRRLGRRFERAMVNRRSWSAVDQRRLFIEHPARRQVAARLVWASFDATGALSGSFRVADDGTLHDSRDAPVTVPDETHVGVAHPLDLGDSWPRWREQFAAYKIVQPFPQLERETPSLSAAELAAAELTRFAGRAVSLPRVLSLIERGWELCGLENLQGVIEAMSRDLPGGVTVTIDFDPGIYVVGPLGSPPQTIDSVTLYAGEQPTRSFDLLDDVSAAEILREVQALIA